MILRLVWAAAVGVLSGDREENNPQVLRPVPTHMAQVRVDKRETHLDQAEQVRLASL
jgi:hypothetical protein